MKQPITKFIDIDIKEHFLYDLAQKSISQITPKLKEIKICPTMVEKWKQGFKLAPKLLQIFNRPDTSTNYLDYYNLVYTIATNSEEGNSYLIQSVSGERLIIDTPRKYKLWSMAKHIKKITNETPYLISHHHGDHYNPKITQELNPIRLSYDHFVYTTSYGYEARDNNLNKIKKPTHNSIIAFPVQHNHTSSYTKTLLQKDPSTPLDENNLAKIRNYAYLHKNLLYITDTGRFNQDYINKILERDFDYPYFILMIEKNYCGHNLTTTSIKERYNNDMVGQRSLTNGGHMSCRQAIKTIVQLANIKNSKGEKLPIKFIFLHKSTNYEHDSCPFNFIELHTKFDIEFNFDINTTTKIKWEKTIEKTLFLDDFVI